MIEIKREIGDVIKVYAETFENEAWTQVKKMGNYPAYANSKIRIMPDAHAGKGCTVGTTMTLIDKVTPNLVGVDIGCFTGDTKVKLTDGRDLSFIELIEEDNKGIEHFGFCLDENKNIKIGKLEFPRKIKTTNILYYITLDNGETIKCTDDHIFYKRNGDECCAKDLKIGDSLYPLYIQSSKNIDNNANISNKRKYLADYLCVYDVKDNEYKYIHYLADDYNIINNVYDNTHQGEGHWVRHHKDFNKFNNNPTNIVRLNWKEHQELHKNSINITNKLGITGFKKSAKLHPTLYSDAGKARAKSTWDNSKNGIENRKKVRTHIIEYNKSNIARERSKNRMINNNPGEFSKQNSEEWMKNKQKLGKIKKVVLKCNEVFNIINAQTYNETIKKYFYYNYPSFEKALIFLNTYNISIDDIIDNPNITINNHKIVNIEKRILLNNIDTYCLTNFAYGNFALSSGCFVHNCGMLAIKLKNGVDYSSKEVLDSLDDCIRKYIPSGFEIHTESWAKLKDTKLDNLLCKNSCDLSRAVASIGSLGGGNHFIELDYEESTNSYWLVIHTGSRNLGVQVCKFYQDLAFKNLNEMTAIKKKITDEVIAKCKAENRKKDIQKELEIALSKIQKPSANKDLAHLEGDNFKNYIHDMEIVQEYAALNRATIAKIILQKMKWNEEERFETIHNYIDIKNMILRKGSVSAQKEERLLIPINMRDGSLICVGKGNEDWNCSAPHGAGRLMSRSKAKEIIDIDDYAKSMEGIYTTCVNMSTIDESPMAYKDKDEIIRCIEPTVEVVSIIKPIYNFKAGEE